MFPAAAMASSSTSGGSYCSSSQPPSQRLKPCGVRVLQARAPSRQPSVLPSGPRPGQAVCVATTSSGSGGSSSSSGGGGSNPSRKVRREALGGASTRVNGSRTPGKAGSSADEDPLDAEQEQGFVVSDLLMQPPNRVQQKQQQPQEEEEKSVSAAPEAADAAAAALPAEVEVEKNGKKSDVGSSSGARKEEEEHKEVLASDSTEEVLVGEALTSSSLDHIETSTLLGRVKDVQQKNTELQKQLNETVALLGLAARALEDRQAAQASGAMNAALGDARTPEGGGVGRGTAVLGNSLEEDEAPAPAPAAAAAVATVPQQSPSAPASAAEGDVTEGGAPAGLEGEGQEGVLGGLTEEDRTPEVCVMQHPGIVCCTETSVARDPSGGACAITMRTVASRHGGGGASVNLPHMVALAAQAMQSSAAELSQSNNRGLAATVYTERRMDRHKQIRRVLQRGDVVEVLASNTSQFGHENFVVVLQDPEDPGLTFKAIFKPRIEGDGKGWHRASIEAVAYKLNLLLGMDCVPPVAYRTGGIDCHYRHFEEGAFIYFAHNASELREHEEDTWGIAKDVLLSNIRILDVLLHNSDRHHGHILLGEHWVEGSYTEEGYQGMLRPMLIDHAAGFRKEAVVTMQHENAFQTGPVTSVSAKTYLRLRFLDASTIASSFSKYLSEREMRDLLMRRNTILRYLDRLVETNGYEDTVIEQAA